MWNSTSTHPNSGYKKKDIKSSDTSDMILNVGQEVIDLLLKKNKDYGDTANNPPQIFSKLSAKEGILARIDDKLSRIKKIGFDNPNDSEDTLKDLIGYLMLLKVQIELEKQAVLQGILDNQIKQEK
tara:strand:- start:4102 stop:4479 length:378 start_codon:yes stop_codon:yes gene_type:complete